jgi:hypothetical protein
MTAEKKNDFGTGDMLKDIGILTNNSVLFRYRPERK